MEQVLSKDLQDQIASLKVLIVDDEYYMRKVVRTMLLAMGVKFVVEADDGMAGLEAIKKHGPDIVIVDWEMPMIDGAQFVKMVRTPGEFPAPDVPIIILSAHSDHWRVVESARIGANEFVRKPVSIKTLEDRILAVINRPRPTVKLDGYYGPMPRRLVPMEIFDDKTAKPEIFDVSPAKQ